MLRVIFSALHGWAGRYRPVLANRAYTYLLGGALFSLIGDLIAANGVIWALASRASGAALLVTALAVVTRTAFVASAPVIGHLIDRYGPLRTLTGATWLRTLLMTLVLLTIGPVHRGFTPWALVALMAMDSAVAPVTRHAEGILTQVLVTDEHLMAANALQGIQFDLAYIVGPLLGGLLNSTGGIAFGLAINIASFLVYLRMALWLTRHATDSTVASVGAAADEPQAPEPRMLDSLQAGFRFLRSTPALLWVIALGFSWNLFIFGPIETIYPLLTRYVFRGGPFVLGLLTAANSAGFIVGLAVVGGLNWRWSLARSFAVALVLHGLIYVLIGLGSGVVSAAVLLTVGGVITGPTDAFLRRIRQKLVPISIQGRVSAVTSALGFIGAPLGAALAGLALQITGGAAANLVLAGCGALLLISAALILVRQELGLV